MGSILSEMPTTRDLNADIWPDYDRMVTRRSCLVLLAAALYGLALALIAAWPTHVDQNYNVLTVPPGTWLIDLRVRPDLAYRLIEGSANVVLFLPFGVLLMLAFVRLTWLRAAAVALAVSAGIELMQGVALPGRTANAGDIAANTLGATLGALMVAGWRAARRRGAAGEEGLSVRGLPDRALGSRGGASSSVVATQSDRPRISTGHFGAACCVAGRSELVSCHHAK